MIERVLRVVEPFIVLLLGTVLLASLLPPRGVWATGFGWAADAGIVLLFFLHGAKLSREAIVAGARNWRLHAAVFASTFALFPLFGLLVSRAATGPVAAGLLFLTLLPSTVQSSIAFTSVARGNVAAAVCSASFSNLAGIVVTPALAALLMRPVGGSGGFSLSSAESIVGQLLVPFVAGHLLRPVIGGWVERYKGIVSLVDRGSILLVVYTAFGAAVAEGLWHRVSGRDLALVFALCCVLLAAVLAATWAAGRALGFARADRVVLVFCGSKKSLASGVPMAGVLFPPAQVGLVILPLMIFHQIQLIGCAVIARRWGDRAGDTVR